MKGLYGILGLMAIAAPFVGLLSCSRSGTGGDDGNNPYVVVNLHSIASTDSSITLSWTATGDDSNSGTASVYDFRYARTWMNVSVWDSAVKVTGIPKPRPAGETETLIVGGLEKDSTYYFALNVSDEAGNWSGVSNCAMGSCFIDVIVNFPDPHLDAAVRARLSKPTGDIYRSDMFLLTGYLDGNFGAIKSLSGLEFAVNLEELFMAGDSISDLTPIEHMTKLVNLQLGGNNVTDISPIAGLLELRGLVLGTNHISTIAALTPLTKLHIVMLDNNQIADIAPLVANSGLAATDTIYLGNNPLSQQALNTDIPVLEARGVTVIH